MGTAETKSERDATYDVLRGIAILTMLCANVIGYVSLPGAHPLWIRFYGSFAAPLFITISGLVATLGVKNHRHGFGYFVTRGLLIVLTGAVIDVAIWNVLPFTTYDVLYLIGFAFVLVYFFEKLSLAWKSVLILAVFAATPILQHYLGYTDYPSEYGLNGELTLDIALPTPIWQHWLVDGWFPVFPWLGFAFLGNVLLGIKERLGRFRDWRFAVAGLAAIGLGAVLLWRSFGLLQSERGCYSEIFYPPVVGYLILAVGVVGWLCAVVDGIGGHPGFLPLRILGQTSLFIYILHTALVQLAVLPYFADPETEEATGSFADSLLVYGLVTLACFLPSLFMHFLKRRWTIRNFVFRLYFGG